MQKKYACSCGKEFDNSQTFNGYKKFNEKLKRKNKETKEELLQKWVSEKHKCENCGKVMNKYYGSGRFCSSQCARSFSTKDKRKEINKKVSDTLKNKKSPKITYCKLCNKKLGYKNITGYCAECIAHSPELKEYRSKRAKHRASFVKPENRKYWKPRNQISYPEQFFIKVLNNNNISFIHDYLVKIDIKHWYYLDFYIEKNNNKIDLEIDGKQHEYEERKQKDLKRNKDLSNLNYAVYRIKWNEINSDNGKKLMKEKIDKFLEFYNNL